MDQPYFKVLLTQFGNATTPQTLAALDMDKVREAARWAVQRIDELSPPVQMTPTSTFPKT